MIEVDELVDGGIYLVSSPTFEIAIWDATNTVFIGPELVDGKLVPKEESHYNVGLPFGLCKPLSRLGEHVTYPPFMARNTLALLDAMGEYVQQIKQLKLEPPRSKE